MQNSWTINFLPDMSDEEKQIAIDFWALEDGKKFKYTLQTLAIKYHCKKVYLTQLIYKGCILIKPNVLCSICNINTEPYEIKTRDDFKTFLYMSERMVCKTCQEEKIKEDEKRKEVERLRAEEIRLWPIKNKYWDNLTLPAMEMLLQIISIKSNHLTFMKLFDSNYRLFRNNPLVKEIQLQNLVSIKTNKNENYPPSFSWEPELEDALKDSLEYIKTRRRADEEISYDYDDTFKIKVFKNSRELAAPQNPRYTNKVLLRQDFCIKANVNYMIGVWEDEETYKVIIQPSKY